MTTLQLYGLLAPFGLVIGAYLAVKWNLHIIERHRRTARTGRSLPAE